MTPMHTSEISTSVVSCLCAYLQISGRGAALSQAIAIAPISHEGASEATIAHICKRLGIDLEPISVAKLGATRTTDVILAKIRDSGWILLQCSEESLTLINPNSEQFQFQLPLFFEVFSNLECAYSLKRRRVGVKMFGITRYRSPRLYRIKQDSAHFPEFCPEHVIEAEGRFKTRRPREREHEPLIDLSVESLLACHASICPDHLELYGRFRDLNLGRCNLLFLNHPLIPDAIAQVTVGFKHAIRVGSKEMCVAELARLYSDFQAIHPFLNGNGRIGISIVEYCLRARGLTMDWTQVTSAQHYYWVRLAQNGKIKPLLQAFEKMVKPISNAFYKNIFEPQKVCTEMNTA